MNKCVFILPYFGKFNNYFPLFLRSCGKNSKFNWLIFTDDKTEYNYPPNVKVHYCSFDEIKNIFEKNLILKLLCMSHIIYVILSQAMDMYFKNILQNMNIWDSVIVI